MRRSAPSSAPSALVAAAALTAIAAAPAAGESLVSLPEPDYAAPARVAQAAPNLDRIRALIYPTIGCPSIVEPGGEVVARVLLDDGGRTGDWSASIRTAQDPAPQRYPLAPRQATYDATAKVYHLRFAIPSEAPEDTYDLAILSAGLAGGSDAQPNAVRVLRSHQDLVFAHVADTQIQDPQTLLPQKFGQLLYELKLRDVAFALFSGDINFGADYVREFAENWSIMQAGAVPLVCAPGNHDGYCWLTPTTAALDYDGLHYWRRTFGPTHFAISVGGLRIVAANSYDGPHTRRNSLTVLTVNAGGQIDPPQLGWIEQQAREASAAGQEMLAFMHHNPSKGITPNAVAFPWDIANVGLGSGIWNDPFSKQEIQRIATDHAAFSWVFAGHTNHDEHKVVTVQPAGGAAKDLHYVNTTSPANGGNPYEGYRLVTVRSGRIADLDAPAAAAGSGSVPFPLGANLFAHFVDPADGTRGSVGVQVENRLPQPVEVTVKVALLPDARGYRTTAGRIRDVGVAESGAHVVYVRVTAPGNATLPLRIEADPNGRGAQPNAVAAGSSGGSAGSSGSRSTSSGGGGSGCSFEPTASPWPLGALGLLALALLVLRLRRRSGSLSRM